jgi:hypothetical protein
VDTNTPKSIDLHVFHCEEGYYIGYPEAKDKPEYRISKFFKTEDQAYAVLLSDELI